MFHCEKSLFVPWFVYVFWCPDDPTGIMYPIYSFIVLKIRFFMKYFFQLCKLYSCATACREAKAINLQHRLIIKYCSYYILFKIISENTVFSRYLMYKFLLFLDSGLKVHSTFCFEASFSLRLVLPVSLVAFPMFTCASGEREVCREGQCFQMVGGVGTKKYRDYSCGE